MFDWIVSKKRGRFQESVRRALWDIGPGEWCWLNISDAEFFEVFGDSPNALSKHDGIYCVLIEAWGGRVYVTCPKFSGRPAGD